MTRDYMTCNNTRMKRLIRPVHTLLLRRQHRSAVCYLWLVFMAPPPLCFLSSLSPLSAFSPFFFNFFRFSFRLVSAYGDPTPTPTPPSPVYFRVTEFILLLTILLSTVILAVVRLGRELQKIPLLQTVERQQGSADPRGCPSTIGRDGGGGRLISVAVTLSFLFLPLFKIYFNIFCLFLIPMCSQKQKYSPKNEYDKKKVKISPIPRWKPLPLPPLTPPP